MTNLPSSTFTIFGALGLLFVWGLVLVSRKKNNNKNKKPNKIKLTKSILQASEIIIDQDKKIKELNVQLKTTQILLSEYTIAKGVVDDYRINECLKGQINNTN